MSERLKRWSPSAPTTELLSVASTHEEPAEATDNALGSPQPLLAIAPSTMVTSLDLSSTDLKFPPIRQPTTVPLRRYTRRVGGANARPKFTYGVTPRVFQSFWLLVLSIHLICAIHLGLVAGLYFYLLGTGLIGYLTLYGISVNAFYLPPIGVAYFLICGVHAYFVATIVFHSLRSQRSVFTSTQFPSRTVTTPVMRIRRLSLNALSSVEFRTQSVLARLPSPFVRGCYRFWNALVKLYNSTAIANECYDSVYVSRQLLQSLLHIQELYSASTFLPRPELNRIWVALFAINCWATPLLSVLFKTNRPRTRLLCVLINLVLDVTAVVIIPTVVFSSYYAEYDHELTNFPASNWYWDAWLNRAMNEFWMLLVVTPLDFVAKMGIAYNVARGLRVLPMLLEKVDPSDVVPLPQDADANDSGSITMINSDTNNPKTGGDRRAHTTDQSDASAQQFVVEVAPSGRWSIETIGRFVLVLLGALVLAAHGHASKGESHTDCHLSMNPWFTAKPACSFLVYRCLEPHQRGRAEELVALIDAHEASFVSYLSIRFCPHVEIPPQISTLNNLIGLKMYNSTIAQWDDDAALTHTSHRKMRFLFLIDVDMAELPSGLQSHDFPRLLFDFEVCRSNLTTLPDDLDAKWPVGMTLVFDECAFTVVPPVLSRMRPSVLSLVSSYLETIPTELLEIEELYYMVLNGNPLVSLPQDVVFGPKFYWLSLQSTALTELPESYTAISVDVAGSPYCESLLATSATAIPASVFCYSILSDSELTTFPIHLEELLNGAPP